MCLAGPEILPWESPSVTGAKRLADEPLPGEKARDDDVARGGRVGKSWTVGDGEQ